MNEAFLPRRALKLFFTKLKNWLNNFNLKIKTRLNLPFIYTSLKTLRNAQTIFLKIATTLEDLLFIYLMTRLSHGKQMKVRQNISHTNGPASHKIAPAKCKPLDGAN